MAKKCVFLLALIAMLISGCVSLSGQIDILEGI